MTTTGTLVRHRDGAPFHGTTITQSIVTSVKAGMATLEDCPGSYHVSYLEPVNPRNRKAKLSPVRNAIVTVQDGRAMCSSRDVAALFGKEHRNVLRSIDQLQAELGGSKLSGLFTEHLDYHDKARKEVRGYSMTKDGFTLLAMGFTGPQALRFKLAYIQRFNELEAELQAADRPA